jgi:3-oxoacyl-[acyl-carrier protein] reductase
MELGLDGKVALVTGVNNPQWIGAATALALAAEGVKLGLVYKRIVRRYDEAATDRDGIDRYVKANNGDASEVERQLRAVNADFFVVESDISDEAAVASIYAAAEARYGGVDILVNNAAHYEDEHDTIASLTSDAIDQTFSTNVRGTLLMIREFVARRRGPGRIVNLSTDAAQTFAGQITYGASKATIEAFTRSIAIEVGEHGITVNAVAPGPTQTGYIDEATERRELPGIPLGRLGTPQDIADTIVFLVSERASWLTGQVIKVSGGHSL